MFYLYTYKPYTQNGYGLNNREGLDPSWSCTSLQVWAFGNKLRHTLVLLMIFMLAIFGCMVRCCLPAQAQGPCLA